MLLSSSWVLFQLALVFGVLSFVVFGLFYVEFSRLQGVDSSYKSTFGSRAVYLNNKCASIWSRLSGEHFINVEQQSRMFRTRSS